MVRLFSGGNGTHDLAAVLVDQAQRGFAGVEHDHVIGMSRRREKARGNDQRGARGERGRQAGKKKITHENSLRRTTVIVERLPRPAVDGSRLAEPGKWRAG